MAVLRQEGRFRLQAQAVFLTWPQCPLSKQEALNQIKAKLGDIEYAVICEEDHHETDGRHLHAVVIAARRFTTRDARFFDLVGPDRSYHGEYRGVDKRRVQDPINYVKKDGDFIEDGTRPEERKKLTMKERNEKILREGIVACIEDGTISVLSAHRAAAGIQRYRMEKNRRREMPEVKWYYGPTGTGKTRLAVAEGGRDYWISGNNLRWFDGYEGQATAILDDIRTNSCPFNFLLRLLDRYPLTVEIKGGFTLWNPKTIIITCPVHPRLLYVNHETGLEWDNIDQLLRRIETFRDFENEPYNGEPLIAPRLSLPTESEDWEEVPPPLSTTPGPESHMEDVD